MHLRSRQAIFCYYSIVLSKLKTFKGGLHDSMTEGLFRSLSVVSVFIVLLFEFFLTIVFTYCVRQNNKVEVVSQLSKSVILSKRFFPNPTLVFALMFG